MMYRRRNDTLEKECGTGEGTIYWRRNDVPEKE